MFSAIKNVCDVRHLAASAPPSVYYISYTSYTESTNYVCRLLINMDFCCPSVCSMCPPRAETQAARRLCHCFMALSISCWSILSHLFYDFYENVTIMSLHREYLTDSVKIKLPSVSWHIHLRIFADSFINYVQKLWEIYGKTNVSLFFWTRYRSIYLSIYQYIKG